MGFAQQLAPLVNFFRSDSRLYASDFTLPLGMADLAAKLKTPWAELLLRKTLIEFKLVLAPAMSVKPSLLKSPVVIAEAPDLAVRAMAVSGV